jgi:hypothetical protein
MSPEFCGEEAMNAFLEVVAQMAFGWKQRPMAELHKKLRSAFADSLAGGGVTDG